MQAGQGGIPPQALQPPSSTMAQDQPPVASEAQIQPPVTSESQPPPPILSEAQPKPLVPSAAQFQPPASTVVPPRTNPPTAPPILDQAMYQPTSSSRGHSHASFHSDFFPF